MDNFKNILRLIGFVPIGGLAQLLANIILFAYCSLFFDWRIIDILDGRLPLYDYEEPIILFALISLPTTVLAYKVSHMIKPIKLTNKKFIITHSFFLGLNFSYNFITYFVSIYEEYAEIYLLLSLLNLITISIFTLMIKDRKYNLFNMGEK